MSLHKKAKERGITPSSREENERLFHRIIDGRVATQRLVEGNMAYVVHKAESFLDEHFEFEYLKDDLISEGFLVLTRIGENVARGGEVHEEDFSPQGMISVSLRNAWLNMIRLERETPLTNAIAGTLMYDESVVIDLRLDILACCEDDRERQVIEHRCQGLMDEQIGVLLSISNRRVGQIREEIFQRFQKNEEFREATRPNAPSFS